MERTPTFVPIPRPGLHRRSHDRHIQKQMLILLLGLWRAATVADLRRGLKKYAELDAAAREL